MSRRAPQTAVFDLDGVITDTAVIHFKAWKITFDEVLNRFAGPDARPFEHDADYVPYVDGKPRYDGVAAFLGSRGIELPYGDPGDPAGFDTVCAVGNRKNDAFLEILDSDEIPVFSSTVELVDQLIRAGTKCGVASSSKNCRPVLERTGLIDRFDAIVDGTDSPRLGLAGKPAPDIFVTACEQMGGAPEDSCMFEDAYVGVEAGKNGAFGLVVGIARNGDTDGLLSRGAHIAVRDLNELSLEQINGWFTG
jgi:HAD superfamily hydrolase (TIGR01509 family)